MNILGYDWKVVWLDENINSDAGSCRLCTQVIGIAKRDCPQQVASTVLHEIIEALNAQLELSLAHNQISALETGMFQTLTANGVDLAPLLKELNDERS